MVHKLKVNIEQYKGELVEEGVVSLELGLGSCLLGEGNCSKEDEMTEILICIFCWKLQSYLSFLCFISAFFF